MSIADEIRNMNSKFLESKTQESLKSMTLENLAQEWRRIDEQLAKEDLSKEPDAKKNTMSKLANAITPEGFKSKLDDYLVSLTSNQYHAGDFHDINTLMDDYATINNKDDIKQRITNLKSKIAERRLAVNNPINLNLSDKNLGFESINLEANSDIVGSLTDKKSNKGKTITFKNSQKEDIAGVEFDKDGHADIMLTSSDGKASHYMLYNDGSFGIVHNEKAHPIEADKMSDKDKKAFEFANQAKTIWNDFAEGKVDKNIEKDEGINVNEANTEEKVVTVNQEQKNTSKVNEFNPLINMIDPTKSKINEGESNGPLKKEEGELNAGDLNPRAKKEDEEYWKEGDIIDTMFKWLVSGANSATNFCVHQMEYAAGAIWDQFEKDVINAKAVEVEKANTTQKMQKEVTDIHNKEMKETKKDCNINNVSNLIKNNQLNSLLDNNPAFAALYEKSPHLQQLMSPEYLNSDANRKTAASVISSTLTMTEAFSNKYALASIMEEKIKNKAAFKDANMEEVFNAQKQQGLAIFLKNIDKHVLKNRSSVTNDQEAATLFTTAMTNSITKIDAAITQNNTAIEFEKYSEKGKNPDTNVHLAELNSLLNYQPNQQQERQQPVPAPETLSQEVENDRRESDFQKFIKNGFEHEEATAAGQEENLAQRRQQFNTTRNTILLGLGEPIQSPMPPLKEASDEAQKPRIPFPYRGR